MEDESLIDRYEGLGPDDMFDEGNSMDLSPIKISDLNFTVEGTGGEVEDTFYYRRHPSPRS